ncbi:hypothetical protein V8E36_005220 [Tilletia maclaganii]
MFPLSPFKYLVGTLTGVAITGMPTCDTYLDAFSVNLERINAGLPSISRDPGYFQTLQDGLCGYCPFRDGDSFLASIALDASQRYSGVGILIGYVPFNVVLAYGMIRPIVQLAYSSGPSPGPALGEQHHTDFGASKRSRSEIRVHGPSQCPLRTRHRINSSTQLSHIAQSPTAPFQLVGVTAYVTVTGTPAAPPDDSNKSAGDNGNGIASTTTNAPYSPSSSQPPSSPSRSRTPSSPSPSSYSSDDEDRGAATGGRRTNDDQHNHKRPSSLSPPLPVEIAAAIGRYMQASRVVHRPKEKHDNDDDDDEGLHPNNSLTLPVEVAVTQASQTESSQQSATGI